MKWCKTISTSLPLREVRLAMPGDPGTRDDAEARIRERERTAFERGVAEGERRLGQQLLQQRAELLELQNGVLQSIRQSVHQVIQQGESALIELAIQVAQKLVSDMPFSTEMVEAAIRSALALIDDATEFTIHLHADDLALLQKVHSPLLENGPGNEPVHFHVSPEVTRGGCLVQTHFGIIDARLETKMTLIRKSMGV